jgi:hypothetical protein
MADREQRLPLSCVPGLCKGNSEPLHDRKSRLTVRFVMLDLGEIR